MNREQKIAWSVVIMFGLGFVLSGITVSVLYYKFGMPRALVGLSLLSICGLAGFSSLFFKKDKGKVTFDERDKVIKEKATLAGFAAAFLFAGLACMIPFFMLGPKANISVTWLPNIWTGTFLTAFFVHSVAVLVQYGWGGKENE
jgi:dolichol kinase